MSQICNTAVALSADVLRDKKRLAGDAGLALLGAASEVFKAAELSEHGGNAGSAQVYLAAARERLAQASGLLAEVASLLASGELSPEMRGWYERLDVERLYDHGVAAGLIPASSELWSQCVSSLLAGGPLGACQAYRDRIDAVAGLLDSEVPAARSLAATVELATYAQLGAYINNVEPLDERWVRQPRTAAAR
jgi:hypothetical protein